MFTTLSLLRFLNIALPFHNIVFPRRKTSILYVIRMLLMLYIRCIFILPSPTCFWPKKRRARESPLLVSCLTSFRINGHQHHQDLALHIRDHLISHLMLQHKYPHQDALLVLLSRLLEQLRYTLI